MGLYYQTEYRLGRRGGRVCRTYTGLRAFLAIAIDLCFVLTFDLFFSLLFFGLRLAFQVLWVVAYALSFPFRLARWVGRKLERRSASSGQGQAPTFPLKPAWASFDEV